MEDRYIVRRQDRAPRHWRVIHRPTGEVVVSYGKRTNWIDGEPYGPEAAAHKMAEKLSARRRYS